MPADLAEIELKFIKSCLENKRAFTTAQGSINGYNFSHPFLTWLWAEIVAYEKQNGHKPGVEFVDILLGRCDDDMLTKGKLYQQIITEIDSNPDDIEFYIQQLVNRRKLQHQLESIAKAQCPRIR